MTRTIKDSFSRKEDYEIINDALEDSLEEIRRQVYIAWSRGKIRNIQELNRYVSRYHERIR